MEVLVVCPVMVLLTPGSTIWKKRSVKCDKRHGGQMWLTRPSNQFLQDGKWLLWWGNKERASSYLFSICYENEGVSGKYQDCTKARFYLVVALWFFFFFNLLSDLVTVWLFSCLLITVCGDQPSPSTGTLMLAWNKTGWRSLTAA